MTYEQYLLMKLAEEAAELAQIALKTAQFGPFERYAKADKDNLGRVEAEFNDVLGVVKMLNEYGDDRVLILQDPEAIKAKVEKIKHYQEYSLSLGEIDSIPEEARINER